MSTVSIIIPIYNEADCVNTLIKALEEQALCCHSMLELVFVDDGSTDASWRILQTLTSDIFNIRLARFSRNFGKEAAVTCGLHIASGDAVVIMDADLQDPPELLPKMIDTWQSGAHVVCAKRIDRKQDGLIKRITAKAFYKIYCWMSEVPATIEVGDFRLLDRKVVQILSQMNESTRYMKGLLSWPGFKHEYVYFKRPARVAGKTKYNYLKLWNLALDGIISFSSLPLRVWSYLGAVVSTLATVYAGYIVLNYESNAPDYSVIIAVVLFIGGIQLISIGVVGEYISRIYSESKQRPLFVIDQLSGISLIETNRLKQIMPKEFAAACISQQVECKNVLRPNVRRK